MGEKKPKRQKQKRQVAPAQPAVPTEGQWTRRDALIAVGVAAPYVAMVADRLWPPAPTSPATNNQVPRDVVYLGGNIDGGGSVSAELTVTYAAPRRAGSVGGA